MREPGEAVDFVSRFGWNGWDREVGVEGRMALGGTEATALWGAQLHIGTSDEEQARDLGVRAG
jgi:hypothetical protein